MTDHAHEAIRGFCHAHGLDSQALDALRALVADLLEHERARVAAAVEGRRVAEEEGAALFAIACALADDREAI